eukprot:CAMPEP_0169439640 /NCGR_PEP_ID=MMETSP1042-20121227/7316_1 /TAXON_ID=464988 /ORGANISM="Hemiselmis andersenii, Strain CCMP1180" /LENGTH=202 /DNA_ID=CAMNT_0009550587 /DNA_START=39 /DNA_END=647 /DNA_ORIENTATION=+
MDVPGREPDWVVDVGPKTTQLHRGGNGNRARNTPLHPKPQKLANAGRRLAPNIGSFPRGYITWVHDKGLCIPVCSKKDACNVVDVCIHVAKEHYTPTVLAVDLYAWHIVHNAKVIMELEEGEDGTEYLVVSGDLFCCDGSTVFPDSRLLGCAELFYNGRNYRDLAVVRGVRTDAVEEVVHDLRSRQGHHCLSETIPNLDSFV